MRENERVRDRESEIKEGEKGVCERKKRSRESDARGRESESERYRESEDKRYERVSVSDSEIERVRKNGKARATSDGD
eukprot:1326494-Amorphochlora_amoeboformis.AAC.1